MIRLFSLAFLVAGCSFGSGATDDKDDGPPIFGDDSGEVTDCSEYNPVIEDLITSNGGLHAFESVDWPTIRFDLAISDEDGDLDRILWEMWWDEEVDGSVDTSDDPPTSKHFTLESESCGSFTAGVNLLLQVGQGLSFNTVYDWAIRITDANGLTSEVAVVSGVTPQSDGEDGSAE